MIYRKSFESLVIIHEHLTHMLFNPLLCELFWKLNLITTVLGLLRVLGENSLYIRQSNDI